MLSHILYPQQSAFETGMLNVGDGHQIYWEKCGKQDGVPVLFLHGGPGAGCCDGHRRFFDPNFYQSILFDQRGSGRSRPIGRLEANDTQNLIADIEMLRNKLGIEKWIVFGGSWGSTLALAYSQAYPARVNGLVLRGIFLGQKSEVDWFLYGMGDFFPEAHRAFREFLPISERNDILKNYYKYMCDPDPDIHLPAVKTWAKFEAECCVLIPNKDMLDIFDNPDAAIALGRLEAHYFINGLFLKKDQLLNHMQIIKHIPAVIIQGRYDIICPPKTAYKLSSYFDDAQFVMVDNAGHSATEVGITMELIKAMEKFKSLPY